MKKFSYQKIF